MFPTGFKPLLASNDKPDLSALTYPLYASPKLDGWRCVVSDWRTTAGEPRLHSRKLETIPNRAVQAQFGGVMPFIDGELVTYTNGKADPLDVVQSKLSKVEGEHDVRFHAFDYFVISGEPYRLRLRALDQIVRQSNGLLTPVPVVPIETPEQLKAYWDRLVDEEGEEGAMTRSINGRYKFGRSTLKEEILLKLKRFSQSEGIITGMRERMSNTNEAKTDALGHTKRSSAKAGKVGLDTMGSFDVAWEGVEFSLGTGAALTDKRRAELWAMGNAVIGKPVTFSFQRRGPNGKPLLPTFDAIREDI